MASEEEQKKAEKRVARKREMEERKNKAREKRSLASERAKTRLGTERKAAKEVPSFELTKPREQEDENQKSAVSPRRLYDFWQGFQKRQAEALKKAGVSTTGYKISNVKMLYDKNGREKCVKVGFAGGGSIEDSGNKIQVFHSIRRKKPRFNKLYALLQAIKERGWKAVEGEIPPEMRTIVLRACKAAGIPLQAPAERAKSNAAVQSAQKRVSQSESLYGSSKSSSKPQPFDRSRMSAESFAMTQDWGRKEYLNSERYKHDCLIDKLFRQSNGKETEEIRKLCDERALDLMKEVFGEKLTREMKDMDRVQSGEAMAFFLKHMGMTPEQSQEFYKSLSPDQRITVFEYCKGMDNASDLAVRAQQLSVSFERYLNGDASKAEKKLFEDLQKQTGKKLKSVRDLENLPTAQVNKLMDAFGKNGLEFDEMFKAENGFLMPKETLGKPALDAAADVFIGKTSKTALDTIAECYHGYPSTPEDLVQKSIEFERQMELENKQKRKTRDAARTEKLANSVPTFVKVAKKLPDDKRDLQTFEGMAAYIGVPEGQIRALTQEPKSSARRKLVSQGVNYFNLLKKDPSLRGEALKRELDAYLTADALTRQKALQARLETNKRIKQDRQNGIEPPAYQEKAPVKEAAPKKRTSTLQLTDRLKKMQKKQSDGKPRPAAARQQDADKRGAQFQAYVLRQRQAGR